MINKLEDLCINFEIISVYDKGCYSVVQLVYKCFEEINRLKQIHGDDMSKIQGTVNEIIDKLWQLEGVIGEEVKKVISGMVTDGSLGDIINNELLGSLNTRVLTLEGKIPTIEANIKTNTDNLKTLNDTVASNNDSLDKRLDALEYRASVGDTIRLCSHNIFHVNSDKHGLANMYKNEDIDILAIQESGTLEDIKPISDLFSDIYTSGNPAYHQPILSNYIPVDGGSIVLKPRGDNNRNYTNRIYKVNNKTLSVYNIHLDSSHEDKFRIAQLRNISDTVNNDSSDYVVIMGDTNVRQMWHLDILGGGFVSAQGYKGNFYRTWIPDDGWGNVYLDNIIVSNNISLENIKTISSHGSDHYGIIAELILQNVSRETSIIDNENGLVRHIDLRQYNNTNRPTDLKDLCIDNNNMKVINCNFNSDNGFGRFGFKNTGTSTFLRGEPVQCRSFAFSCKLRDIVSNGSFFSIFFNINYVSGQGGDSGNDRVLSLLSETPHLGKLCHWFSQVGRTVAIPYDIPNNEWGHYCFVVNDDNRICEVYVNGIHVDTTDFGAPLPTETFGVLIGGGYNSSVEQNACFGYVKQWSKKLTSSEVRREYEKECSNE